MLGRLEGFHVERLDFQVADMKDDQGLCICMRVLYRDIGEVQQFIFKNEEYQKFINGLDASSNVRAFVAKNPIAFYDFYGPDKYTQIWHVTMITQIARWYQRQSNKLSPKYILFINQRPWMKELDQYVQSHGGRIESLGVIKLWRWKWHGIKAKISKLNGRLLS